MRRLSKPELLEGIDDVEFSKIVKYNTVKYKKCGDDKIYIRFHNIDIIVFHHNYIVLNSGKNMTKVTKSRMNEFQTLGCYVKQTGSRWYVRTVKGTVPFFDGIKINKDGTFIN